MANDNRISFDVLNVQGASKRPLSDLALTLRGLGLDVKTERRARGAVHVEVAYPSYGEAYRQRTRLAGRTPTYSSSKSPVFDAATTAADALAWLDEHTPAEGAEALACARSTYFRRRERIREAVEERRDEDERRKAAGRDPFPPLLLSDVLGRKARN